MGGVALVVQTVLASGSVTPELLAALAALPVPPGAAATVAPALPELPLPGPAASPLPGGSEAAPGSVLAGAQAAMAPFLAGGAPGLGGASPAAEQQGAAGPAPPPGRGTQGGALSPPAPGQPSNSSPQLQVLAIPALTMAGMLRILT